MPKHNILYLVHDLHDAAVHKRVAMLTFVGAQMSIIGFNRTDNDIPYIHKQTTYDLGRTYNAGFAQRILSVLKHMFFIKKHKEPFMNCDAIIARNLEMLAIAIYARYKFKRDIPVVYESLDIHRLLLNKGITGKILRALEGRLTKNAARLWTSSPAFIENYFSALSSVNLPTTLIENKVFDPKFNGEETKRIPKSTPWKIGWFGAIRCSKSLNILKELAEQSEGKIEVIIRGKPSYDQFENFDTIIKNT